MRLFALLLLLSATALGVGGESAATKDAPREEVARLLQKLDSNRFEERREAAERLEALMNEPEWKQRLADEFQRVLVRADVSFEVRWRLERWIPQLPPGQIEPPGDVSSDELDRLVRQLNAIDYGARVGASRRLDWLLGNPHLASPILKRLKQQLADESLDAETRRQTESLWRRARKAWLAGDTPDPDLPPIADAQINRWLDALTRPIRDGDRHASHLAQQELLDVLTRDDYVPRLVRLLHARLDAGGLSNDAVGRLQALLDWTKPEIAIETWRERHLTGVQHVLVGVPTKSRGATQIIHFDRVDDRTAHGVSNHPLPPGDYAVGTAIPHPSSALASKQFFHLVNLSTPRRRMAYADAGDEQKRLAAISRRTLDRMLAEKNGVTSKELAVIPQLDPVEVSRFAAKNKTLDWWDQMKGKRPAASSSPHTSKQTPADDAASDTMVE
jgi:hypothetical protein